MNISFAARKTGLSPKTIRYYEAIQLIPPAGRKLNGYRNYDQNAINQLNFVGQARRFGFSIDECRELLELYQNPLRRSARVHELVAEKLDEVDRKVSELLTMRTLLSDLVATCPNDDNPECAIINSLSDNQGGAMDLTIKGRAVEER